MGTPDFAAVSLEALVAAGHEVCGVLTQPDKPRNRNKVTYSAVKEAALAHGIPVYQPITAKDEATQKLVEDLAPELTVVVAYGQILPQKLLDVPKYGSINVHASLLPKYRGAAPIQWAVLDGEAETGVSIMYMTRRLDAGDVISTARTAIGAEETAPELWDRLARLGGELLVETIPHLADGTASRTPQDESAFTYAPMLTKAMSPVDWSRPASAIHCQIRGLQPWPCAIAEIDGRSCKLFRAVIGGETDAAPGTILRADKRGIEIACGDGRSLRILELQGEGGKRMNAASYLNGHPIRL